jgi:hypothetical protein|tara:strand:+ start:2332 stop:2532 length:201 start_codon:yes stop_codon:yes gene_type:complete
VAKMEDFVKHLEIALDVLDRVEGTTVYEIQKKSSGWTDKDYSDMLSSLAIFLLQIQTKKKDTDNES